MANPVAIAAAIHNADTGDVFVVRRPDDPGEDFAGMWGLPAATLGDGESVAEAIQRLGRDKLGIELEAGNELTRGQQPRDGGALEMILVEAMPRSWPPALTTPREGSGVTHYTAWDWGAPGALRPTADQGSLCSRLYLDLATGETRD